MDSRQELILGKLAVVAKMITKEQLKHCLQLQQEQTEMPLAIILLQQESIDEKNLSVILEKYFAEMEEKGLKGPGEELALCRMLLRNRLISSHRLADLLVRWKTSTLPLTHLLLQNNYISATQLLETYAYLEKETINCPGCEKQFRILRLSPGKKLRCKHCKTVFNVPNLEHETTALSKRISTPTEVTREIFGDYEVLEEIAEGGMGIIYRAQKQSTGQIVALKVLREANRSSSEAQERFQRESQTLKERLAKHKNIVTVFDIGIEDDVPYFAMEFIDGKPLSDVIMTDPLPIERMVPISIKLCEGVHYAHSKGVIHRDLKPSNIILATSDEPFITDFGLAKCVDSMSIVTRTGAMIGTPYYMSPEQAKGQLGLVGPRSDIYSLGVIFYEMLTAKRPFTGENPVEIYQNILLTTPVLPSKLNPNIPKQIDRICLKCLEKNPFHRYKTAEDIANDLRNFEKRQGKWWANFWSTLRRK